jgi:hypothetical protein
VTFVQSLFDFDRSRDADFHVLKNGREVFGQFLPPNSGTSYSNLLSLAAGDTIDFAIGRGADGTTYDTGLKIQATLTPLTNSLPPPTPQPHCVPPPSHLVAWWPAEQNPNDVAGTHHATLLGRTGYGAGRVGSAFAFRGGESGARIPASRELNVGAGPGFTIEGWINPADLSVRSPLVEWNRGGSNIVEWGVHLYILGPDEFDLGAGNLYANLADASGQPHFIMAPGGTVTANTWQHIALTYDRESGMGRLYRNGAVVGESQLGNFTPETTFDLYLGRRPAGDAVLSYNGMLDEISIYGRALGADEIAAVARAGSAGKCRMPASLDELLRLVQSIPASVDRQTLLAALENVRAAILRGNLLSALQQLADFQNKVRALLGGVNPTLSAQIISQAQFVIEILDPTGARRSELQVVRNIPMRVERVQAIQQADGVWWIQGCARPGSACCVQRSINLQDWEHAGTATEVDDGIFEYLDVTAGEGPRFYRLVEQ